METQFEKHNSYKTQADAVVQFIQRMDAEMVCDILDGSCTYQGFEKSVFIHKLDNVFNELIEAGDTFLNCYSGFCKSETCNYRCTGFSFIGNKSKNYLDLIIDVKEGIVYDIYECSDFKSINAGAHKNNRIRIHEFKLRL